MIVKINGEVLAQEAPVAKVMVKEETIQKLQHFGRIALPISFGLGVLNMTKFAHAAEVMVNTATAGASIADKLKPLIHLAQDLALPVGVGVAIWGIVEMMCQNPNGGRKVKTSILGFAGIFVIPYVFYAIRDALQGGIM